MTVKLCGLLSRVREKHCSSDTKIYTVKFLRPISTERKRKRRCCDVRSGFKPGLYVTFFVTGRNRSWAKVMFLQASVCPQGEGSVHSVSGYTQPPLLWTRLPWGQTPPLDQTPPGADPHEWLLLQGGMCTPPLLLSRPPCAWLLLGGVRGCSWGGACHGNDETTAYDQ